MTNIFNGVISEGKIHADWSRHRLVNVYKVKGDALACGSYSEIKLQVMKILERVLEKRIRGKGHTGDEIQFGFRPDRGTIRCNVYHLTANAGKFLVKKKSYGWL